MGNTFNAFVKFISDDPIMLGLCIAIIVLIIAFILVLFLGRKKENKEENVDNTRELLKTDINIDALKSTQEYNIDDLKVEEPAKASLDVEISDSKNEPVLDSSKEIGANSDVPQEIPVTLDTAPTALEVPTSNTLDVFEVPTETNPLDTLNNVTDNAPTIEPSTIASQPQEIETANIFDIKPEAPKVEEPKTSSPVEPKPLDEAAITPIIESSISPIEPIEIPSVESVFGSPAIAPLPPKIEEPVKEEPKTPIMEAPFSSVNVDSDAELPSINPDDFSKTEIIKHIPKMETSFAFDEPIVEMPKPQEEDDLDDIDLPLLNTANTDSKKEDKSALNSLQGETFNIE